MTKELILRAYFVVDDIEYELSSLETWIRKNDNILKCPTCKKQLYKYKGNFKGKVKSEDFIPVKGIRSLKKNERSRCPLCNHPLFYDFRERSEGILGLVVFKDMNKKKAEIIKDKEGFIRLTKLNRLN